MPFQLWVSDPIKVVSLPRFNDSHFDATHGLAGAATLSVLMAGWVAEGPGASHLDQAMRVDLGRADLKPSPTFAD